MDAITTSKYEAKAKHVRAALKQWEGDWAKTHNGKKPGREDIKNNLDIAQKYKDYNKIRDILAGKIPPPAIDDHKLKSDTKKRKPDSVTTALAVTPLKRTKYAETPSKTPRGQDDELMNSPAISRKLFSPAPITSLGPTPQRDGHVLGLFDLLVERELGTPSRQGAASSTLENRTHNAFATPTKRRGSLGEDGMIKLGRTPMSSSKRQMLNSFMTPLKKRDEQSVGGTPTSVSKLQFDTPSFLKRNSLPTVDENITFNAPPLRLPRKPLVRGLSEIVASLRKVEEERLDEDLEALRELENEEMGHRTVNPPVKANEDPLLADSQTPRLPLGGFDDEGMYDSPGEDEPLDRDGQPLRIFKKKGQKRTTRLSRMKPTRTKRPQNIADDGDEEGGGNGEDGMIPETQRVAKAPELAGESDADFEDDNDTTTKAPQKKPAKKTAQKDGVVKKAARKVNELAHANFQRLKLRNHGAKGGPGFNSRFRRRR